MTLLSLLPEGWKERLRRRAGAVTPRARIESLRRAGFGPARIIDAGAALGDWTRIARAVFPAASILLIEPQPKLAAGLIRLCRGDPRLRFRPALLGARRETVTFLLHESNSRIAAAEPDAADPHHCRMQTEPLAELAAAEGFGRCDLLKLDLQGHELAALAGAGAMFGEVEVILTEVSLLPIGHAPIFPELDAAFRGRGYRLYDIFGLNHRPLDGALWQADLVYVRTDSPLLARCHDWS
jgi:FkbM family methyltransferase